ncbi:hepatitis A virus cellular receptor 1 [Ictalurus punctatus]|uniref:Hepatitis A virus cellular receptor 1 n=2 Tax=Ictalurus punctatus TaxID=7998 RepID=A0A2D0SXF8_ICTPU|nr:hepatitis A virus cellular receptor 1 [Ictalurus punctatus]
MQFIICETLKRKRRKVKNCVSRSKTFTMSWVYTQISSIWLLLCLTVSPCRTITVNGISGQNVTLPCKYNLSYHGKCEICWTRGEIPLTGCGKEIIATDGDKVVRQALRRYQLDGDLQKGDASLTIHNTTQKDSGRYGCRVHIPGLFNDEKIVVDLVIMKGQSPTSEVNSLLPSIPELVTKDPWYTEATQVVANSTRHYPNSLTPDINKMGKEPTDDLIPVIAVSVLLIFLVFSVAFYLIWKKKRRTRESLEIDQNQNPSAIYNNSEVSLGLNSRSMAVENIYQLDTENEYEQWSR